MKHAAARGKVYGLAAPGGVQTVTNNCSRGMGQARFSQILVKDITCLGVLLRLGEYDIYVKRW